MNPNRYVQWKINNPDSYEEVLRRRRERYRKDEEFRESQLQRAADWREKQRKRPKKSKKKQKNKRPPKPKLFPIDGRQVECWSAGRTAEFLGIDKKTITNLEKKGTIPVNHFVAPNGHRWWPASFVRWLKPYVEQRKSGTSAQEFHRRVWIGWSEEQVRGFIPVVSGELLREVASDDGETQERSVAS